MKLSERRLHREAQDGTPWPSVRLILGGVVVLCLGAVQLVRAEWRRRRAPREQIGPDALVLALLDQLGESHGLQLVLRSRGRLARSTIYLRLGLLESAGLVTSRQESVTPTSVGFPRRLYRLTPQGQSQVPGAIR